MKKLNTFRLLPTFILLLSLMFVFPKQGKACVDPDTIITVTLNFSADMQEIAIVLGNLKFMEEAPNVICSCALGSYSDFYTNLEYVAFVHTGTNTPYPNFDLWESPNAADDAWSNSQPSFSGWDGYISTVINDGLGPEDDVELVIRASVPAGYFVLVSEIDSTLALSYLGTDAWDPVTQDLMADHQGVRNLYFDASSVELNEVSDSYFAQLDNDITSSTNAPEQKLSFEVQPNPNNGSFLLKYELEEGGNTMINLRDMMGRLVHSESMGQQSGGQQHVLMDLPKGVLQNGVYIVEIVSDDVRGYHKMLVSN